MLDATNLLAGLTAEAVLAERGIAIIESVFDLQGQHHVDGLAVCQPEAIGWLVDLYLPSGRSDVERAAFAIWAQAHVDDFFENAPNIDGWEQMGDGSWQLWAHL